MQCFLMQLLSQQLVRRRYIFSVFCIVLFSFAGKMFAGRGRGTLPTQAALSGVGSSYRKSAAFASSAAASTIGGLRPAATTLEARVTEVIDPGSFWAQLGEGRRSASLM